MAVLLGIFFLLCFVLEGGFAATVAVTNNNTKGTDWKHIWEACVGSGHAALGLRSDWRAHLAQVHKDLGFQRVRFHGLFDDDMNVVLPTGTSFYNIDSLFDYIFSIGMDPLVELSFSPETIATSKATIFHYKAFTSIPNATKWTDLIKSFGLHLQNRYGRAKVEQLMFEVWNEPNCGFLTPPEGQSFSKPGDELDLYYTLYRTTVLALKSVNSNYKIGGPVTCMSAFVDDFLSWTTNNKVPVDFVSTHIYPTDPNVKEGDIAAVLSDTLASVRKHSSTIPLIYSETNDGLFGSPPLHDYPYAASYIVRALSMVGNTVPLLSWWTFTDVFEEQGFPQEEFDKPTSTGWGLISASGIPKPSYRAFQLLHRSGNLRLPVAISNNNNYDVGALATSGDSELLVFVWNFVWPSQGTMAVGAPEQIDLFIDEISAKSASTVTYTRIDTTNANAPQKWREMGRPDYLTSAQVADLINTSNLVWNPTSCNPEGTGCRVPPFNLELYGLLVFSFKL